MNVIAFDTECSRDFGTHCEMCSFGYVVADSQLSVEISRKCYIKASKPTGRQKKAMRTPYEKFSDAPEYPSIYPALKDIFDQGDTIFISHSPETDFRYICCMNRRYGQAQVNCKAYDILTVVRNYADIPNYSLSGIMHTFGLKYNRKEENADAKACIEILRYICREESTSLEQLLSVCGHGAVVDSEVINHRTLLKFKQERLNKYYDRQPKKDGKFKGFSFSIAESFEGQKIEIGFHIAETITHYGGKLTRKVSDSQVFVWDGNMDSKRLESVNVNNEPIEVITTDQLFSSDYVPKKEDGGSEKGEFDEYLRATKYVDYDDPAVRDIADRLRSSSDGELSLINNTFRFVRDNVRHSWDAQDRKVTVTASQVLREGTGICWAKSNLLAALLRANGIPAGFSYQRIWFGDSPKDGYVIHGLNAVYLKCLNRWVRLDARGNKPGIDAQFSVYEEKLAFYAAREGEIDYNDNHPDPDPSLMKVLEENDDAIIMCTQALPDHLSY